MFTFFILCETFIFSTNDDASKIIINNFCNLPYLSLFRNNSIQYITDNQMFNFPKV